MVSSLCYWKQLWRWIHSDAVGPEDVLKLLDDKATKEQLKSGLSYYKPLVKNQYVELQKKHSQQTKLLPVAESLQTFLDLDTFQTWEIIMHYLCEASYGTPADVLKNVIFLDTRPAHLLPKVFHFYRCERLFLLKLLKLIIENKDNEKHKYHREFSKILSEISIQEIKCSLIAQFGDVLKSLSPPRMPTIEMEEDHFKRQWALYNLWEQLEILQILILICQEVGMSDKEFMSMFDLFKKHDFSKKQSFNDVMEQRHRDVCVRIMFSEVVLFLVVADGEKIKSASCWIETCKDCVEIELDKLQPTEEHAPMLLAWMLLTLESEHHRSNFDGHYQHYGVTALRLQALKFLHILVTNDVFCDDSKVALISRMRIFELLNSICDKFDGNSSISQQPFAMELCGELLSTASIADKFWTLYTLDGDQGVVSMWNTALEYFPHNFSALSHLAAGLARAGKLSVKKLMPELKSLPVYTEIFKPNVIRIVNIGTDTGEVVVGQDYFPLDSSYKIPNGSSAAIMERKEGTFIHFRTPISYWTVLGYDMEFVLDRKLHNQREFETVLNRVWEGTKVLNPLLQVLIPEGQLPKYLIHPCEASLEVLLQIQSLQSPPIPLLKSFLETCTILIQLFPEQVYARLLNTSLLPRLTSGGQSAVALAGGAALDAAGVGARLVDCDAADTHLLLAAYVDLLCAAAEMSNEKILLDVFLPGVVLVLREVFPNLSGWRHRRPRDRRALTARCVRLLSAALDLPGGAAAALVRDTCVYSLLHLENSVELLKIVSAGDHQLQQVMCDETNWTSGPACEYLTCVQRSLAILLQILRLKGNVADSAQLTPIEHLMFTHKQSHDFRVIPSVVTYVNHAFNQHLPALTCRLLNKLAVEFQMSLFACLEMTSYQVRVLFLDRLRDRYESTELKTAILVLVGTCVGTQPGLTEAFFNLGHGLTRPEGQGVLAYMADYLANVKASSNCLHSPLLSCIMALFHALWKNNMQVLIRDLTENPKFWDHMTSPLFNDIQKDLRAYAQTFNVLGIELFVRRGNVDKNFTEVLEKFFDTDQKHLDKWIEYIFSFEGRNANTEKVDEVPTWLGLLTSWKDFTTIFCKCLPVPLNIAHKSKMVSPCTKALLNELKDASDSRLIVILSELYIIMLANWNEDCFDNRKVNVKQIDELLNSASLVYEALHPRAKRAILSIATVAISTLDYEIKANSQLAQNIIRSVTNINSYELDKLYEERKLQNGKKSELKLNGHVNEGMSPIVLSLSALEQCLDLYDDMFSSLSQWFQTTRFVNKLLCCLQACLQSRQHYHTSLAALRCLTAYARGPFSKDLLFSEVDQFLWMALMPPKAMSAEAGPGEWKPQEWWKVYAYGLEFVSTMVRRHGELFAGDALCLVGVHGEQVAGALLLPRQEAGAPALELCAAAAGLVLQLVRYQHRWQMDQLNCLNYMMRNCSACVQVCVWLALRTALPRAERDDPPADPAHPVARALNRILEIIHMGTLSLLSFSPALLSLLASDRVDVARWQPLVELHFGAPQISYDACPLLSFGTLLSAVGLLTKALNHPCGAPQTYHPEDASSPSRSRSPRAPRRRPGSSPGAPVVPGPRADSVTSVSSTASALPAPWLAAFDRCLVANTLEAVLTLISSQALLMVKNPSVSSRDKQLIRRELSSELIVFHDFVRKRILTSRNVLVRNKLGIWPLSRDEEEQRMVSEARREDMEDEPQPPPPPPPRRSANDSMREFILRKQYLKATSTPVKQRDEDAPSPLSQSTPASAGAGERRKEGKRVSWAETTQGEESASEAPAPPPAYSPLTHVQVNNDEDYFHFMSLLLSYVSQCDL